MPDRWAMWLAERRFGGDAQARRESLALFERFRERVLERADVRDGDTVVDVGCGEGLIGFGALELVGDRGTVVFTDISEDVLDVCREVARGDPRCEFVRASADDLRLDDARADVLTTRSVVIYVADKQRCLAEFHRVLQPGGRLAMFEPVNSFGFPEPEDRFGGYDVANVRDLADKLKAHCRSGNDPLTGWDERDLVGWIEAAGFADIEATVEYEIKPRPMAKTGSWDALRNFAPNPLAPTMQESMDEVLTLEEQERFVAHLRPLVERRAGAYRMASAYVRAVKS